VRVVFTFVAHASVRRLHSAGFNETNCFRDEAGLPRREKGLTRIASKVTAMIDNGVLVMSAGAIRFYRVPRGACPLMNRHPVKPAARGVERTIFPSSPFHPCHWSGVMEREPDNIRFEDLAEVRRRAEHRRAGELVAWLIQFFAERKLRVASADAQRTHARPAHARPALR
jgi:hypothetical protein